MTFSTSMLCKERDTTSLRFKNCSLNVAATHVHGTYDGILLCEECILSYVTNVCLLASLQHACCLASPTLMEPHCIAPICDMHSTLQRNIMWIAYTPLESLQQIQEEGHRFLLRDVCSHHACCLPDNIPECVSSSPVLTAECWKMHAVCQVTLQSSFLV